MRVLIRKFLAGFLGKSQQMRLKRFEYKLRKTIARLQPQLDSDGFKQLLTRDLGLTPGETVMIHGGLSLINTQLSAAEICDLVLEILGSEGTLVVPTFSPINAVDYMLQDGIFDVASSKSGMGAIAENVRRSPGAIRSVHPTKSVAAIGRNAKEICAGHENCAYPFGSGSPFEKLLSKNARIIGIGVPMSYLSFVHAAEDMNPDLVTKRIWDPRVLSKTCRDGGREIRVSTRVHDMTTMARANPEKFCRNHIPKNQFKVFQRHGAQFFSINAQTLQEHILCGLREGLSIYD